MIYYMNLHYIIIYIYIEVVRADPTGPRQDPAYLRSESYAPQRYTCFCSYGVLCPMFNYGILWNIYDVTFCFGILVSIIYSYGWDVI